MVACIEHESHSVGSSVFLRDDLNLVAAIHLVAGTARHGHEFISRPVVRWLIEGGAPGSAQAR
jgi:hypothetical protein